MSTFIVPATIGVYGLFLSCVGFGFMLGFGAASFLWQILERKESA